MTNVGLLRLLCIAAVAILVQCRPQDVSFPSNEDYFDRPPPDFMPRPPPTPQTTRVPQNGQTSTLPPRTSPSVATSATQATTRIPPRDNANRLVFTVSCPCNFTRQYAPVCGTDGQTYGNIGVMNCAVRCGTNVSLYLAGACGRNNG